MKRGKAPGSPVRHNLLFRATRFEREQQSVVCALIVSAAFLSYLGDGDDVVWRFVKNDGARTRTIERGLFLAATCLIGIGAYFLHHESLRAGWIGGEPPAVSSQHSLGQFLCSTGLASLVPVAGFYILVVGEVVRLVRQWLARDKIPDKPPARARRKPSPERSSHFWSSPPRDVELGAIGYHGGIHDQVAGPVPRHTHLLCEYSRINTPQLAFC